LAASASENTRLLHLGSVALKRVGRVVDFFGVAWHLGEALRIYSVDDRRKIAAGLVSVQDDLNTLDERHRKTLLVYHDAGIFDIANTEACVHLLRDEIIRAKFSNEFEAFLSVLNSLRFRPEARKYISDAKQLGFINKSAANLYRDSQLEIADCGKQVSELIDKYLISRGIDPEIEPIDVMDAEFDKEVEKQPSDRAKAAAMEHAAKAHISQKMDDDPVFYQEFSERIKKVLVDFAENWKEQKEAFFKIIGDMRTAEGKSLAGLAPYTQVPFFRTLMKHAGKDSNSAEESVIKKYAGMTVEILDHVRQEIRTPGFWQNPNKREVLRSWVEVYLLENDALDNDSGAAAVADDLVDQAHSKHTALI
jgi:type I restriction enzyme, R subunit